LIPGARITPYYDGMLAKLICWGEDREQARLRMIAALDEFSLLGVTNTAAFLRDVIASQPFCEARLSTRFLEASFPRWRPAESSTDYLVAAAALATEGRLASAQGVIGRGTSSSDGSGNGMRQPHGAISPWTELAGFEPGRRAAR
jgi:acetyl/propionyl-CoA carboxylase alpha subunit